MASNPESRVCDNVTSPVASLTYYIVSDQQNPMYWHIQPAYWNAMSGVMLVARLCYVSVNVVSILSGGGRVRGIVSGK